jgi:hypothetical protein
MSDIGWQLGRPACPPTGNEGGGGAEDAVPVEAPPAPAAVTQPTAGNPPGGARPATPAQVKALYAVARSLGVNLPELLRGRFGVGRPEDLNVRQASALIDQLKGKGGPAAG